MKENLFVIGDIHGCYDQFLELLTHWDSKNEQLVLLGDLIDRGKNSLQVLNLARSLKEEYGAVVLGGNHEDLFLSWLGYPVSGVDVYYFQGGIETINSFGIDAMDTPPLVAAETIQLGFPKVVEFVRDMPDFYETENYIFVHAGVNLRLADWKLSGSKDFKWIRDSFHWGKNETGKVVVFGHTPTQMLNEDSSLDVWFAPCGKKIGLDGGAVFGGLLHGLRIIDGLRHEVFSVAPDLSVVHEVINKK